MDSITLVMELYNEILHHITDVDYTKITTLHENRFIADPELSLEKLILDNLCFGKFFDAFDDLYDFGFEVTYICESLDFDEDPHRGEYYYISSFITYDVPFLFMNPSHDWVYPRRVIFYDPKVTMEISASTPNITTYRTLDRVRKLFFIKDADERVKALKDFLKNTDRPRLDE